MPSQPQTAPAIFISYSHLDGEYKDDLVNQLSVLAEQGVLSQWHDGLLTGGERWNDEIVKQLRSSRVILFLISVDFLNSVYVNEVEIREASVRYQAGDAIVIPVLLRSVVGWKKKPFGDLKLGDLQALPANAKFINRWRDHDEFFTSVAAGIERAIGKLKPATSSGGSLPSSVPTSYLIDYVRRHDDKGRDILEELTAALVPGKTGPVALWGKGGSGKTRIAAEAVRTLALEFKQRIVWISADGRTDFTFSTFLDEIARELEVPELQKLPPAPKEEAVQELIRRAPVLIVLDNFETVATEEARASCVDFLAHRANCPSLITSRIKVAPPARLKPIRGMTDGEARELLAKLIEQTQEPKIFKQQVRSRIITMAESNPYVIQGIVAQIDEAQTPKKVLDELQQGKGALAARVFDRSFTLALVGEDGRAALLALTLFVRGASRRALAEVAGFGDNDTRMDEAARNLRMLWLIGATEENERLSVTGLTRSLATSRLVKDNRLPEFSQRFVAYFLNFIAQPQNPEALEEEKDNLLKAIELAFDLGEWRNVMLIRATLEEFLDVHGYWDAAIASGMRALQAARNANSEAAIAGFAHNVAVIHQYRGDFLEARRLYDESLAIRKSFDDQRGIASNLHELGRLEQAEGNLAKAGELYNESLEISRQLGVDSRIAQTLHQLAMLKFDQGNMVEARQLFDQSLSLERTLNNQSGIAGTLHELGRVAYAEGNLPEAHERYNAALAIAKKMGEARIIAGTLHGLGTIAQAEGDQAGARRRFTQSLKITQKLGDQSGIAECLHALGTLKQAEGNFPEARRLYNQSLAISGKLCNKGAIAVTLHQLAILAQKQNQVDEARKIYNESLAIDQKLGNQRGVAITLHRLAMLAHSRGNMEEAHALYSESLEIKRTLADRRGIAITARELGRLASDLGNKVEAAGLLREAMSIFEKLNSPEADTVRRSLERLEGEPAQ